MLSKAIDDIEKEEFLYKILSLDYWNRSVSQPFLILSEDDKNFIHLSKQTQVDGILEKFWSNISEFMLLKIKTNELIGKLVYEVNSGGTNKYYHLYEGAIPLSAIVEVKIVKSKK